MLQPDTVRLYNLFSHRTSNLSVGDHLFERNLESIKEFLFQIKMRFVSFKPIFPKHLRSRLDQPYLNLIESAQDVDISS